MFLLLMILYIAGCFASTLSQNTEVRGEVFARGINMARTDSILQRMLDSRGGRLLSTAESAEEHEYDHPGEAAPEYTREVHDTRRLLREVRSQKLYPICQLERNIRRLNTEEYEYRPAYYEEVICSPRAVVEVPNHEICSSLGFSCVQLNRTLHLTKRLYSSDCWESEVIVVPATCECMWPSHLLGEMKPHL